MIQVESVIHAHEPDRRHAQQIRPISQPMRVEPTKLVLSIELLKISTEHIDTKNSLDSKLQIGSISSVKILANFQVIIEITSSSS